MNNMHQYAKQIAKYGHPLFYMRFVLSIGNMNFKFRLKSGLPSASRLFKIIKLSSVRRICFTFFVCTICIICILTHRFPPSLKGEPRAYAARVQRGGPGALLYSPPPSPLSPHQLSHFLPTPIFSPFFPRTLLFMLVLQLTPSPFPSLSRVCS